MYRRGTLIVLALVAALLVAVVVVDTGGRGGSSRSSRRIVPEYADSGGAVRLVWQRPGENDTTLEQSPAGQFVIPGLPAAAVNQAAVQDVLATVEILSYVGKGTGRLAERGLRPPQTRLLVALANGQEVSLGLGARIDELDRVWAVRDGQVYLIEGYAARALDRRSRDLRVRQVFAAPADRIGAIEMHAGGHDLAVSGRPARVHVVPDALGPESTVLADPARVAELAELLAEVALVRFVDAAEPGASGHRNHLLAMRVVAGPESVELNEIGPCPEQDALRLVKTTIGTGCVTADIVNKLGAYPGQAEMLFARSVLAGRRPVELALSAPGHSPVVLRASGRTWIPVHDETLDAVESDAVNAWLDALDASSAGHYVAVRDDGGTEAGTGTIVLTMEATLAGGHRMHVRVYARDKGLRARRDREPLYLLLDVEPFASRLVPAGALRFRRRQLLSIEPYSLRSATKKRGNTVLARLERGLLLDDWHLHAAGDGKPTAAIIESLRELGRLRVQTFLAMAPAPVHGLTPPRLRIEIRFDPGPGDPEPGDSESVDSEPAETDGAALTHVLDIGTGTKNGCAARLDMRGAVFEINAALCATLLSSWAE